MANTHTGNVQPSIDAEEHARIGGLDGKKVFVLDNEGNQIINFGNSTLFSIYQNLSLVSGYNFYGFANPGSNPTTTSFRLMRETQLTGEVLFGDGTSNRIHQWSAASMPSISYS